MRKDKNMNPSRPSKMAPFWGISNLILFFSKEENRGPKIKYVLNQHIFIIEWDLNKLPAFKIGSYQNLTKICNIYHIFLLPSIEYRTCVRVRVTMQTSYTISWRKMVTMMMRVSLMSPIRWVRFEMHYEIRWVKFEMHYGIQWVKFEMHYGIWWVKLECILGSGEYSWNAFWDQVS